MQIPSCTVVPVVRFTLSSYAFRTQEWLNLARDDVLLLRGTPSLVTIFGWLVGWLDGWFVVGWLAGWLVGWLAGW
jgi:hypothetical protein